MHAWGRARLFLPRPLPTWVYKSGLANFCQRLFLVLADGHQVQGRPAGFVDAVVDGVAQGAGAGGRLSVEGFQSKPLQMAGQKMVSK